MIKKDIHTSAPPAPSFEEIEDFYYERKTKITNVKPAVPPISKKAKQRNFLPPPPNSEMIRLIQSEMRSRISHVRSVLPEVEDGSDIRPPPPPEP